MAEHTNGKLEVTGRCPEGLAILAPLGADDFRPIVAIAIGPHRGEIDQRTREDARRLVAAWNAAEGIPTAALEEQDIVKLVGCAILVEETIAALEAGLSCWKGYDPAYKACELMTKALAKWKAAWPVPEKAEPASKTGKMTVAEARAKGVCRICGEPVQGTGPVKVMLNFGAEFAHTECLEKPEENPSP